MSRSETDIKNQKGSRVTASLLDDHERIRYFLSELETSVQNICHRQSPKDLLRARQTIGAFINIMDTHSAQEERVIFPALSLDYPIQALEAEHDEITLHRAALLTGILNYSFPEDCTEELYNKYISFIELMQRHLTKEESIVFPLIDRLSSEEQQRLLKQMELIHAGIKNPAQLHYTENQ